jgi:hypothetical protein
MGAQEFPRKTIENWSIHTIKANHQFLRNLFKNLPNQTKKKMLTKLEELSGNLPLLCHYSQFSIFNSQKYLAESN